MGVRFGRNIGGAMEIRDDKGNKIGSIVCIPGPTPWVVYLRMLPSREFKYLRSARTYAKEKGG